MRVIHTRAELIELARELRVRPDWHEPDEQGLTARLDGFNFDNAGFWPLATAIGAGLSLRSIEQHVVIMCVPDHGTEYCDQCGKPHAEPEDVAAINLATLLAWACGYESTDPGWSRD